jgi:hypothetical protein
VDNSKKIFEKAYQINVLKIKTYVDKWWISGG